MKKDRSKVNAFHARATPQPSEPRDYYFDDGYVLWMCALCVSVLFATIWLAARVGSVHMTGAGYWYFATMIGLIASLAAWAASRWVWAFVTGSRPVIRILGDRIIYRVFRDRVVYFQELQEAYAYSLRSGTYIRLVYFRHPSAFNPSNWARPVDVDCMKQLDILVSAIDVDCSDLVNEIRSRIA